MVYNTKKRMGHQGFSLLEVILALSIFSISAVVLSKGFQSSAILNKKSAKLQEATLAASNLMEEVKANSLEELALEFNYPVDENGVSRFDIMNGVDFTKVKEIDRKGNDVVKYEKSGALDNLSKVTSSIISKDGGETWEFQGNKEGEYYFSIVDLKGENYDFDAKISLDASTYHNNSRTGINDQNIPSIDDLNVYEDAFLVQENKINEKVAEYYGGIYESAHEGKNMSEEEIWRHLTRTLTVDVTKSGGMQKVTADYLYQFDDPDLLGCSGKNHTDGECDCYLLDDHIIYDNSESDGTLRSVYLFFQPNYYSVDTGNIRDRILFNNLSNLDLSLYLIKQVETDSITGETVSDLDVKEHNYKMSVDINEIPVATNWTTNVSAFRSATKLRTNLDSNLAALDSITGNRRTENQMALTYRDMRSGNVRQRQGSVAKTITDSNNLADSEAKDRLFTAEVEIYETGEAANKFAGKPLAVLNGSKED
ncbi:MAG: type II secretion system protein [Lachnospiraceae bacterium]|nr:type II secretion system protein [Lachnospiraceae bacterium]